MSKVLLVEDDKDYAELLSVSLINAGYDVDFAYSLKEASNIEKNELPDLVLLDVMLPDGDGYSLCKEIYAKYPDLPIVMLSAIRQSEEDKIVGLESGAVDYVLKSHSHKELIARVKRILARYLSTLETNKTVLKFSDKTEICLDLFHKKALINNKQVPLTNIELQLFYIFTKNINKILTRNLLLKQVWEFEPKNSQTLKVHLYRLKKKLFKFIPKETFDIIAVRGSGYMFVVKEKIESKIKDF